VFPTRVDEPFWGLARAYKARLTDAQAMGQHLYHLQLLW
jgi:hypothetical protein